MHRVSAWLRWYWRLLQELAQPRDETVLERRGLRRLVLGCRRAENGFGAVKWGCVAAPLALIVLWSPLIGLWFGLALVPLVAHSVARMIGTYREGHLL
jgi:hypothetical protein